MQQLYNAVAYLALVLLVSIPFFFQYRLFRYFDLSLGVSFLFGAYTFLTLVTGHIPEWVGLVAASGTAAMVGLAAYALAIRPLVKKETVPLGLTLCAYGLYIIGVNGIAMMFGDELVHVNDLGLSKSAGVLGGIVSGAQILEFATALFILVLVGGALRYTKLGRAFRALGDSPVLAGEIGITTETPLLVFSLVGAAIMGLTGALVAVDVGVRPTSAFGYIVPGLAAVLMFGGATVYGVFGGALFVAIAGEGAGIFFGQQWREFAIYLALVVALAAKSFVYGEAK